MNKYLDIDLKSKTVDDLPEVLYVFPVNSTVPRLEHLRGSDLPTFKENAVAVYRLQKVTK